MGRNGLVAGKTNIVPYGPGKHCHIDPLVTSAWRLANGGAEPGKMAGIATDAEEAGCIPPVSIVLAGPKPENVLQVVQDPPAEPAAPVMVTGSPDDACCLTLAGWDLLVTACTHASSTGSSSGDRC